MMSVMPTNLYISNSSVLWNCQYLDLIGYFYEMMNFTVSNAALLFYETNPVFDILGNYIRIIVIKILG